MVRTPDPRGRHGVRRLQAVTGATMPEHTYMTTREAEQLAAKLAAHGGRLSMAQRIATMESQGRLAARLIRAMLRQVHSSDVFQLPAEE